MLLVRACVAVASLALQVGGAAVPAGGASLFMPAVCLGTGEYRGTEAVAAVRSAIQLGYRCVDTAHEYQNQQAIGQELRAALGNASLHLARSDLYVISKVEGGLSAAETTARLHNDSAALGLGPIDMVLLHYPKAAPGGSLANTIQEQWRAVAGFVAEGGARAAGVSQFCAAAFSFLDQAGVTYRPKLNQVGYHVGMGADPQGVVSTAEARGDMQLMAYSPLAEADPQLLDGVLERKMATAHGITTAQVALQWLAQRDFPYAAAAKNPQYQAENLLHGLTAGQRLSAGEITELTASVVPAGCPFWPGSACWAMTCNKSADTLPPTKQPSPMEKCQMVVGWSGGSGKDVIGIQNVTTPALCCTACQGAEGCLTWTLRSKACWLHGSSHNPTAPAWTKCSGCTSGGSRGAQPLPPVPPPLPPPSPPGPCHNDADCSLNGVCDTGSGKCHCDKPWGGATCDTMQFKPTVTFPQGYGMQPNLTAWGGGAIFDGTQYHAYIHTIANGCPLACGSNSQIEHVVADAVTGPYSFHDVAVPVDARNSAPVTLPDGSFAIFHIRSGNTDPEAVVRCAEPWRWPAGSGSFRCPANSSSTDDVVAEAVAEAAGGSTIHTSKSLEGPWAPLTPNTLPRCSNPAPHIHRNGTFFIVCNHVMLLRAESIQGPWVHVTSLVNVTDGRGGGVPGFYEDPFLYQGERRCLHLMLFTASGPSSRKPHNAISIMSFLHVPRQARELACHL